MRASMAVGVSLLIACGSSGAPLASPEAIPEAGSPVADASDGATVVVQDGAPTFGDGALADAAPPVGEVYGHSANTLFKLEPFSRVVTNVGVLDCVTLWTGPLPCGDGLWDIAIDKNGVMFGTTLTVSDVLCQASGARGHLIRIDKTTAKCSVVQSTAGGAKYPNSLAFVPEGVLDPTNETLVGYVGADYMRIDVATGVQTKIGSLNPNATGQSWYTSGDIVSVKGGATYLTAKPDALPTYAGNDTLLEIDPATGTALRVVGDTTFPKLWGLGFWAGTAYGFGSTGSLVAIDVATGKGTSIPMPGAPPGLQFWGAGSTTAAPLVPPK
jgi:hypothetical protein